jgi:hypothetical protein
VQVEQAICAAADGFVGVVASTFSFSIVQERAVLGQARASLRFWGMKLNAL